MPDDIRPARPNVLATIGRIGLLRILFMAMALLIGEGLIFIVHAGYGQGHIALPYSPVVDYGACAVLSKPYRETDLAQALLGALATRSERGPGGAT